MKRTKPTVAALLAAGGLFVATGAGALALTLPDDASTTATDHVAEVETGTPADAQAKADDVRQDDTADDEATEETETDADEAKAADSTEDDDAEEARPTDTHGYQVSQLATTTDAEGADKGEAVSTLAKTNGEAKRGDHADDDDEDEAKAETETEHETDHGSADAGEDD